MSDKKRYHVIIGIFLFVGVIFGLACTILDFHTSVAQLNRTAKYGYTARLSLINGLVSFAFSLFLLSFVAAHRNSKDSASLMDILGLALFLRIFMIIFVVFHIIKIEGPQNLGKFQFQYISLSGYVFGLLQALSMLAGLIAMATGDETELKLGSESGRGGLPSINTLTGNVFEPELFKRKPIPEIKEKESKIDKITEKKPEDGKVEVSKTKSNKPKGKKAKGRKGKGRKAKN